MRLATALARFLPTDPGYTPFGLPWLRGLNVLPFALVSLTAFVWMTSNVFRTHGSGEPWSSADAARLAVTSPIAFTPMLLLVIAADNLTVTWKPVLRIGLLGGGVLLGAMILALTWQPLACLYDVSDWWNRFGSSPECRILYWSWGRVSTVTRGTLWSALFATFLYLYKRERLAARALHETHLRRLNTERQETEARLRSLQAQIEPHFLFNTLAHIERLYEVRPAQGREMLSNLVDYLRLALPQMRQPESTLGRELALAQAYLNVQRIRMGKRLRAEAAVPEALLDARLPPLMLVTLVENAIKHGVGPRPQGGTVSISARQASGRLEIEVNDDGVGLRIGAGTGRGLANTRARLATMFGDAGRLEIANRPPSGVRALLVLPLALPCAQLGAQALRS